MESVLGALLFVGPVYLLHPFKGNQMDKDVIEGYSIRVMSQIQGIDLVVNVRDPKITYETFSKLKDPDLYGRSVFLEDVYIKLSKNNMYKIYASKAVLSGSAPQKLNNKEN